LLANGSFLRWGDIIRSRSGMDDEKAATPVAAATTTTTATASACGRILQFIGSRRGWLANSIRLRGCGPKRIVACICRNGVAGNEEEASQKRGRLFPSQSSVAIARECK
jgi:hypothetical protein